MNGASQPGGGAAAATRPAVPAEDLSPEGQGLGISEVLCRLPVIVSALLIIAGSLGLMAAGAAVEFVVLSAIL